MSARLTWQSFLKNKAGDWKNDGRAARGWTAAESNSWVFCGSGVDGKKPFRAAAEAEAVVVVPRGVRARGDANDMDRALSGEMAAGPRLVGPIFEADVSVNVRCHGLRESKW